MSEVCIERIVFWYCRIVRHVMVIASKGLFYSLPQLHRKWKKKFHPAIFDAKFMGNAQTSGHNGGK